MKRAYLEKFNCFSRRRHWLLILFFVLLHLGLTAQDPDSWPLFRGNQQLTGHSDTPVPDDPVLLWTFQTGDMIKSAPVVDEDRIVVGATDGIVYCLDPDGELAWKFATNNAIEAPALIHNGTVYIGNLDGMFYALDLDTGEKLWEYKTGNQVIGSANWWEHDGTTSIFFGSYDYFLHCVDATTGSVQWKYESENFINGAPACVEGRIFFGGCDGFLHVVDVLTGKALKKIDVATYVPGSPAVEDQKAYLGDYDGRFFQVDIQREKTTWVWEDEATQLPFIASPAVSGDRLLTGNHNKFLYSFNKNSGEKQWEYNTGSRVEASPVVAGEKVLAANMRGDLMLLNLSDGSVVWSYEIGSRIISNPAPAGGRIYVGAGDGFVYCFGKGGNE